MGMYRFSIYAHWQIGLMIRLDGLFLEIRVPFVTIFIGFSKYAKGTNLTPLRFNWKIIDKKVFKQKLKETHKRLKHL